MGGDSDADKETKLLHDTPFKQQKLKAWQPILTPKSVVITFLIITIIFIPIGIGILVSSDSVIDAGPYRYDEDEDDVTFVTFNWPESTSKTVYVYYQLSNFYQNHRRYVKSRSDVQLAGSSLGDIQTLGDCSPWKTFGDHTPATIDQITVPPDTDLNSAFLNPCGLIANSKFNDTLQMYPGTCTSDATCVSPTTWTNQGISWSSDRSKKFKNFDGFDGNPSVLQQQNVEDEEFIVWMRTAGLPTFKKLHRIIKGGLQEGTYTMRIDQNFPVHSFDGEKAFYLTTTTWIGGKNDFLGWAYVVVGLMTLVLAIAFFVKDRISPRDENDPREMVKRFRKE